MNKEQVTSIISRKLKLVRCEYGYSQEKLSELLGISKKTLIQVEKERVELSWTACIALCTLFRDSEILRMTFGEDPVKFIQIVALGKIYFPKNKTMGGRVWWKEIKSEGMFKIQQNIISNHYRIIDDKNNRWFSSFDKEYIENKFNLLIRENNRE
ncbi:DNA-binding transcriptional regulator, XRE-family HTH domain [Alkalithermobacter thermoalcaliphilus JW-YL-7 = DSM 7308]|uniref:DNA-binding transcriptional regulator, XRE-family HTH domain n=1 Tax=Alkalithermobacter thermoalcaliphilus JW-YL-7 = DSM 7308 TaxID=1121328 RepID=A0A150FMZ1_CLOPD|nr:transcriptional regulator, XRE family [[Clostridium] paradoxum JW-YL-7 = DSM 7308]SHL27034.1 DNA-binding transcriptional regulator, XRE-family HTH domain [[Clostridium] paradoxum JW-YL-7 = DSM 7308]